VFYLVTGETQGPYKNVLKEIGLKISDVLVKVNSGTAAIDPYLTGNQGREAFKLARKSVKKAYRKQ